jgi:hypothetical protein
VWMLGKMLTDIVRALKPAAGAAIAEMERLANSIRMLRVTTVSELLQDPWLAASGPADLDELRRLSHPLFLTRSSLSKEATPDQEDSFLADVDIVNTRRGWWRVLRVGADVDGLAVGNKVLKVDGKDPKQRPPLAGSFYSEMKLDVEDPQQPTQPRSVSVRRTKLEVPVKAEPDWDRFRRHLQKSGLWPEGNRFQVVWLREQYVR